MKLIKINKSKGEIYISKTLLWSFVIALIVLSGIALATTRVGQTFLNGLTWVNSTNVNATNLYVDNIDDFVGTGEVNLTKNLNIIRTDGVIPYINLFSGRGEDSAGGVNRSGISFFTNAEGNATDLFARGLSIEVHDTNGTHPHHVTFYSAVTNGSSPRAIQWLWGNDTNGKLSLENLNRIEFPESYTGYYQNESNNHAGIESEDEDFYFILDSDNDDSNDYDFRIESGDNAVGDNVTLILQGRASVGYDESKSGLILRGETSKKVTIQTNGENDRLTFNSDGGIQYALLSVRPTATEGVKYYNGTTGYHCEQIYNSTDWVGLGCVNCNGVACP